MENLFEEYPVVVDIPVAWGDMDAFGHVNNVIYLRYFETARVAYFDKLDFMEMIQREGVGPILASSYCRYKLPVTYPDVVMVGVRVSKMETDRFTMEFRMVSQKHRKIAAYGDGVIVTFDYRKNLKIPVPAEIEAHIRRLEGGEIGK